MGFAEYMSMVQTVAIVIGIVAAVVSLKDRGEGKAGIIIRMQSDIDYIKKAVDKLDPMLQRITAVEESASSAHKRLNEHIGGHRQ